MQNKEEAALKSFAADIRLKMIDQFKARGFGHVGGAMSIADTLAVLYGGVMRIDPKNPKMEGRDMCVVSKGHAGPALYAALAIRGFFPPDELKTLNQNGTNLPSHCDRIKTVGIDMTTGSLGQGISTAIGLCLAAKLKKTDAYTYLIIGDGECNEGQIWEGIMFAASKKLSNLIMFVDDNAMQLDGPSRDIIDLGDIRKKLEDFGFFALEANGHDVMAIKDAIKKGQAQAEKPVGIVLKTIKGKGFKGLEGPVANHHVELKPEQLEIAEAALKEEFSKWEGLK